MVRPVRGARLRDPSALEFAPTELPPPPTELPPAPPDLPEERLSFSDESRRDLERFLELEEESEGTLDVQSSDLVLEPFACDEDATPIPLTRPSGLAPMPPRLPDEDTGTSPQES